MYKVSFDPKTFKKVEHFNNRTTKVTLTGNIDWDMSILFMDGPIKKWIMHHESIFLRWGSQTITVSGRTTCHSTDTFDPVLGERIAESKAKVRLYRYMCVLLSKIAAQYKKELGISCRSKTARADSVLGAYQKYIRLHQLERRHLKELMQL